MDPNKIYNRTLDLIGFLLLVGFVICQILKITNVSWWWILFPIIAPVAFHAEENIKEGDENG